MPSGRGSFKEHKRVYQRSIETRCYLKDGNYVDLTVAFTEEYTKDKLDFIQVQFTEDRFGHMTVQTVRFDNFRHMEDVAGILNRYVARYDPEQPQPANEQ